MFSISCFEGSTCLANVVICVNIKNSVLDYIRYKQLNCHGHLHLEKCWKKKKRKTSKFVDAGINNRNEREGTSQHGMGQQRRMEKKNKTLGTERCANIYTLYINKNKIMKF